MGQSSSTVMRFTALSGVKSIFEGSPDAPPMYTYKRFAVFKAPDDCAHVQEHGSSALTKLCYLGGLTGHRSLGNVCAFRTAGCKWLVYDFSHDWVPVSPAECLDDVQDAEVDAAIKKHLIAGTEWTRVDMWTGDIVFHRHDRMQVIYVGNGYVNFGRETDDGGGAEPPLSPPRNHAVVATAKFNSVFRPVNKICMEGDTLRINDAYFWYDWS